MLVQSLKLKYTRPGQFGNIIKVKDMDDDGLFFLMADDLWPSVTEIFDLNKLIIYNCCSVFTGRAWITRTAWTSGRNRYWTSWFKGKWSLINDQFFFSCCFTCFNVQGDVGFQGRPGPPGPPGVGELGPPVSHKNTIFYLGNCNIFPDRCSTNSLFLGTSRTSRCSRW